MKNGFARLAIASAVFLICSLASFAANDKTIPYSKFADAISRIPPSSRYPNLKVRLVVMPPEEGPLAKEMIFKITSRSGTLVVRPQPDGTIEWPMGPALMAENPAVHVNIPADAHFSVEAIIEARIPDNLHFAYADLLVAKKQYDEAIASEAGVLSWFAPSVKGFRIFCGMGCTARIGAPNTSFIGANEKGVVDIPLRDDWGGWAVVLSSPATKIEFLTS